ncbi:uncharacterized protein LOC129980690 [Argiope bruennichi]|uniref:uncharacterized protein LOC129980690 n=1 Tax=Argiope bruennichi TaxID=94029 RepID=UPI002494CCE3|nr:uncharacterized protein LOC129980690 [Argiope bruennichi]
MKKSEIIRLIEESDVYKNDNEVVKDAVDQIIGNKNQKSDQDSEIELERLRLERAKIELQLAQLRATENSTQTSVNVESKTEPEESLDSLLKSVRILCIKPPSKAQDWGFFFTSLERALNTKKVPEKYKAEILLNLLRERASNILTYIAEKDLNNYEEIKSIVLREFEPTAQAVLENFRYATRDNETHVQFASGLMTSFEYYLKLRGVKDLETLKQLIVSDKLFQTLDKETATHINIRQNQKWFTPLELGKECDLYFASKGGSVSSSVKLNSNYCGLICGAEELNSNLRKFWEIEEMGNELPKSKENAICEEHYARTHRRDETGKYTVAMPFKEHCSCLGNSRDIALKRLESLWTRLSRDQKYLKLYSDFLKEYEELGHMSEIQDESVEPEVTYYMPHHGIYRPQKTTTKLRTVFNASTLTSSGKSLNSIQYNGGVIQDDLFTLLIRFRKHIFAFTSDIRQMYRMINIDESQRNLQRILWKEGANEPVKTYQLNTVTYGTVSAPYLAMRTLKQISIDEGKNFPSAASVLCHEFYMDDVLSGASTLEETKTLQHELVGILKTAQMSLHKWCVNTSELIPATEKEYEFSSTDEIKTLGIAWKAKTDCFTFKVDLQHNVYPTKRSVLSIIAGLFDPLGLLGPVITKAKIFMQQLWLLKIDWGEMLPEKEASEWQEFVTSLRNLNDINIERCIVIPNAEVNELHGFCDASEKAHGAAIYARTVDSAGEVKVKLIASKSRVSPIKQVTIPRLELCSAVLLSKLMRKVKNALKMDITSVSYYSDSTIVLSWMRKESRDLKTFVANRVAIIQESTEMNQWHHVPSEQNPADVISRGLDPTRMQQSDLWWFGPIFLQELVVSFPGDCDDIHDSLDSSVQNRDVAAFNCEIKALKKGENVNKSEVSCLNPFLDPNGVLRVGGRLSNSDLSYDKKFPILLPKNHKFTLLVMQYFHLKYLHVGAQTLLYLVRREYWSLSGRNTAREIIHDCVICAKTKPRTVTQIMGNLPTNRVKPSYPFTHVGIDFCGPFYIKYKGQRKGNYQKCYVAVFICFATKAIHLEIVTDLTAEAMIATLKRFFSRRGVSSSICSDNATNFKGANSDLKRLQNMIGRPPEPLANYLTTEQVTWKFIPPRSPNFGGLWEAGDKSFKHHLKRVVGNARLTMEQFLTIVIQIEGILNSRPLTPLSSDPNNFEILTPGHFLIGRPINCIPDPDYSERKDNLLSQWQRLSKMVQTIWKKWKLDYLNNLQARHKWHLVYNEANIMQSVHTCGTLEEKIL